MPVKPGNNDFIPLIFAADINVYSLARAFHEQYGVVSAGFGKAASGPIMNSRIIQYTAVAGADQPVVLPGLINKFAAKHANQRILVLGCGDNYVRRIAEAKPELADNVIVPYLDFGHLNRLANKQGFYEICDSFGIDHPRTLVFQESDGGRLELGFEPPYIVKPANSVGWWEHPFPGQRKVHLVDSLPELKTLLSAIYAYGYCDSVIIQEYIPGDDSQLYVLTQYFDQSGLLRLSCAGQVLYEEHTAYGIGNSAVILSQDQPELAAQLAGMLAAQDYKGFAAFDIKRDPRNDSFKVLEVNTRQGRGNYYVTGSGLNIARFITEDLVYGRELVPELKLREQFLWYVTPRRVARQCAAEAGLLPLVDELMRSGKAGNPLDYPLDRSLKRMLWLARYTNKHRRKYLDYKNSKDG